MKILIADDEYGIMLTLKQLISTIDGIDSIFTAASVAEAKRVALEAEPDAALLDIGFPDGTGLELARQLQRDNPQISILFITADAGFALEAYELYSIDYILKPFDEERVIRTLKRILKQRKKPAETPTAGRLAIKHGRELVFVNSNEIIMLEKEKDCVIVHTLNGSYKTGETLDNLYGKIGSSFYRSHKSYIVNLDYVERVTPFGNSYEIRFTQTRQTALLSRVQYRELLARLNEKRIELLK